MKGPSFQTWTGELDVRALNDAADELQRARSKHGPMASGHEAYAVILEELDEFWEEVKTRKQSPHRMSEELVQIAAMALRARVDLGLMDLPPVEVTTE